MKREFKWNYTEDIKKEIRKTLTKFLEEVDLVSVYDTRDALKQVLEEVEKAALEIKNKRREQI